MAQSKKLADGSYIDASGVWNATQQDTVENLLSNIKDCSSEIASKNAAINNIRLYGLGKFRLLSIFCRPKGALNTNDWNEKFVTLNKAPIAVIAATLSPGNGANMSKGTSVIINGTTLNIHLGGQTYSSSDTNYFHISAMYLVK